jgi:hypothetical protein
MISLPWAQGVGRSNRPAPTNLLLIPNELIGAVDRSRLVKI